MARLTALVAALSTFLSLENTEVACRLVPTQVSSPVTMRLMATKKIRARIIEAPDSSYLGLNRAAAR